MGVAVLAAMWLLYLLSPLDLIPEAVFGLVGLLDDLVIFLLISMYLTFFFRSWPIWERTFLLASISDHLDNCKDLYHYPVVLPKIKIFFIDTNISGIMCVDNNFTRKKQILNCAKLDHSQLICKADVGTSSSILKCDTRLKQEKIKLYQI